MQFSTGKRLVELRKSLTLMILKELVNNGKFGPLGCPQNPSKHYEKIKQPNGRYAELLLD